MRKNWLVTVGGIMAGCGAAPMAINLSGYHCPNWLGLSLVLIGAVGAVVTGVAAKGQDEHSTAAQVVTSTNAAEVKAEIQDAKAEEKKVQ